MLTHQIVAQVRMEFCVLSKQRSLRRSNQINTKQKKNASNNLALFSQLSHCNFRRSQQLSQYDFPTNIIEITFSDKIKSYCLKYCNVSAAWNEIRSLLAHRSSATLALISSVMSNAGHVQHEHIYVLSYDN